MEKKVPSAYSIGVFSTQTLGNSPNVRYDDDESITVHSFPEEFKLEDSLNISLRFCFDHVQMNSRENQEVPACLFLANGTPGAIQTNRPGVDVVFVIDISGSMMGVKLELLKKTLEFMTSKLSQHDRVALVSFNNLCTKLSPLICMTDKGKALIYRIISNIKAYGSTEIVQGLDMGLKILSGRKVANSVSSIILLSDGKDNNSHSAMPRTKEILLRSLHEISSGFSIHTFGYGADHDAGLLNAMAEEKNGGFYYVEHENAISEVFSNCLGELISVIADNIQVDLIECPCEIPCHIGKVYSDTSAKNFRMPPVLSGDTKEAIFMLNFPAFQGLSQSINIEPIKAIVTYKVMKTGRSYSEEKMLNIIVHPETAMIEDIQLDASVMINFYRVKTCEVMKEGTILADRGNIQGAREVLGVFLQELRDCVVADSELIVILIRDMQEALGKFATQSMYDVGGKATILSKANNHCAKRAVNVPSYQNHVQNCLKFESESFFSKKHG